MFAHLRWADRQTLAALRAAAPPPPKALELYAHVLGAEHVWLSRLLEQRAVVPVWPLLGLDQSLELAEANASQFEALLGRLSSRQLDGEVAYLNSAGMQFRSTRRDMLLHVALHGCYHRGQVALLLREAGAVPEPTDYIAFVRGVPAATRRG